MTRDLLTAVGWRTAGGKCLGSRHVRRTSQAVQSGSDHRQQRFAGHVQDPGRSGRRARVREVRGVWLCAATRRVNGNSVSEVLGAFVEAKTVTDRPYVMVCDTRIFEGVDCLKAALPAAHYVARHQADWEAGLAEIGRRIGELEGAGEG